MGLTRYWYRPSEMDPELFRKWTGDCRAIIESASLPTAFRPDAEPDSTSSGAIIVRGPEGVGKPLLTEGSIALNGDAAAGQEHEPFCVEMQVGVGERRRTDETGRLFEYCKTNGKPYDAVVDACLIAMQERFGSLVRVEADSVANRLEAGQKLYSTALDKR